MFFWRMHKVKVAALAASLLTIGCYNWDTADRDIDPVEVNHSLSLMESCADYEEYTKETAIQRMRTVVEKNCQQMLDEVDYYGSDFGWGSTNDMESGGDTDGAADEGSGSSDYSETNTQEEGVDEADILKTDGEFIYVLSGKDMVIVTVDEQGVIEEVGRVTLEGRPEELFLYGETGVVFGSLEIYEVPEEIEYPDSPPGDDYYYYDGYGGWYGDWYTGIQVLDLSDKSAPVVLKNTSYAGRYVSSRRVGNALRAVVSSPMTALDVQTWVYVDYWDMSPSQAKHEINQACDALIASNVEIINSVTLDDILPRKMVATASESEPIARCEDIYGPETPAGTGLLTIISLDLDSPLDDQTDVSVVGQEGIVYASPSSLYITTARDYAFDAWVSGFWMDETSGIHKFDIESSASVALYAATGSVEGRMLDQFCLGEHEGFLRVATTTGSAWWEENTLDNHISIFEQTGRELSKVSQIDGIGTEEEIYASRFMGDRGFLVTYLQMDPLFTFDLSDPYNPRVVGEWEGPGYSTYLHPFGEDLLIAVGVDEDWRTVLSLYNLGDFANPTLVERQPLPTAGCNTAALYEHKAFTFNPNTGELMLPFYDWGYNEAADTGVLLYDITEEGVSLEGTLQMGGDPYDEGPARRSMYNGDNLIGVSACRITSAPLSDPTQIISSIPIWEDHCDFPGWWNYYY